LFDVRADVLKALELKRVEKVIGHPLDAAVRLSAPAATVAFMNDYLDKLRAICIVSRLDLAEELSGDAYDGTVVEGLKVLVEKAPGEKCERCWCYSEELGSDAAHPTICPKCTAAVV
jgi:Isoleucyl-tRNA synthetase (EC 6.1.1.5)